MPFDAIAFDADDTLWHTEHLFTMTQDKFTELLSAYHSPEWVQKRLYATEMRNLRHFGYGVKSFSLSMIETAIELTEGRISGAEIGQIVQYAREMLESPVELLDGVRETVETLANNHRLLLITKGDLIDQEMKVASSGLGEYFEHVEIVSHKTPDSYRRILQRLEIPPPRFLMIGNSLRSDVLPVLDVGGRAVHIPHEITWAHEEAEPDDHHDYAQLDTISDLPQWVANYEAE